MEPLALRPATAADTDFLRSVYAGTRAEELALTGWSDAQKEQFCGSQFQAQTTHYLASYPTAVQSIIERAGVPAGRLYVERGAKAIHVLDIALLPGHRGAGIGTRLLRELQDEADATGRLLTIHVEKFNPARRLYSRLGFREVEDLGVYLLLEWQAGAGGSPAPGGSPAEAPAHDS